MNKRQLDDILEKYDMVISEAMYKDLLNPAIQPFANRFHEEPLAFTAIRALEMANMRNSSREAAALLTLLHGYFDCTALTSIDEIKDRAHKASDNSGIKYNSCLEIIAREYGYSAWNELIHSGRFTK